jgi:FkbM family methyltransferase
VNVSDSAQQLEAILRETVEHACQREREAFDSVAGPFAQSIVLYGAGNLGRKVLAGLRKQGIEPLAFADANPALSGKKVEGLPVYSPPDAVAKFGHSAVFVVCVWHPDRKAGVQHIVSTLKAMGATSVVPFAVLFWKYSEDFLPHYFWDLPSNYLARAVELAEVYELLADEISRAQFVADLQLRVHACFPQQPPVASFGRQYFPRDLFRLLTDECFVDCGAYDGDTIRDFIVESGGRFRKVIAFEADPHNFLQLEQFVSADAALRNRIALRQEAVGRAAGTLRFTATASSDAWVSHSGDTVVTAVALDDVLASETPTMIKMDIEGSELDALKGAEEAIKTYQPLLAICAYHRPADFCELPFTIKNVAPEARLFLRSHALDGFDTVCYAVRPERSAIAK